MFCKSFLSLPLSVYWWHNKDFMFFYSPIYPFLSLVLKKALPNPRQRLTPIFSCKSFIILSLAFMSIIYCLRLICIYEEEVQLDYFAWGYQLSQHHLLENSSYSICTIVKIQLTINVRIYLWTLNSFLLIYMSALMLAPHCLNDCSCSVSFKLGKCWPPTLFFISRLFRLVLVLAFPYKFYDQLAN